MSEQELHAARFSKDPAVRAQARLVRAQIEQRRAYAEATRPNGMNRILMMEAQRHAFQQMEDARLVLKAIEAGLT